MTQNQPASVIEHVRPFSSGTEGMDWRSANCERCQKDGHRLGGAVCPMEEAVAKGFILGTIPSALAVEYGATNLRGEDTGFCTMPRQCSQFVPPAACEYIIAPNTKRRRTCAAPATGEHVEHGLRHAVCAKHSAVTS